MLTLVALVVAVVFLPYPWNVVLVGAAAIVDIAEAGVFVRWSQRRRRLDIAGVGAEALVGRTGVALARIDPEAGGSLGQVRVDGEIWAARSSEPIEPGEQIAVRSVDGLVLHIEPAPLP
jgi:membrane protein implicated in regulation of membrane protease activity